MQEATVCHLLRGCNGTSEILLGKRNTLFRNGIWNGPGGRLKKSESILSCLKREVKEEVGVTIARKSATHYASIDFYHPWESGHRLEWRVHYFTVTEWHGNPLPLEGFSELKWFPRKDLPYEAMMPCQKVWLPLARNGDLPGKILVADIYYGDKDLSFVERGNFKFAPSPTKT